MDTMLVLGANAGQLDLIRRVRARGMRAVACAHRANEPGAAEADAFHLLDVRDVDAVAALARAERACAVWSVASDVAMTAAVAASERLGTPHFFDSGLVDLFNRKERLRGFLNARGLGPTPFRAVRDAEGLAGWDDFPCVLKPADAQGQRGVRRIEDAAGLAAATADAVALSPTGTAIVEGYLDGIEMSCNVLLDAGRPLFRVLSERRAHDGALIGIPRAHLLPCVAIPPAVQAEALDLVDRTLAALGIERGCLYVQMKATSAGVRIIEIAPRLDGCHMWRLIALATGRDLIEESLACLLGEPPAAAEAQAAAGFHGELVFQHIAPGAIFRAADFPPPPDAWHHEHRIAEGAAATPINGRLEVAGYWVRAIGPERVAAWAAEAAASTPRRGGAA